jgi:hypothetical protein
MSVSVYWVPVEKDRNYLKEPSAVLNVLERCYGSLPIKLTSEHCRELFVMAEAFRAGDLAVKENPFFVLRGAVDKYGEISISKEF